MNRKIITVFTRTGIAARSFSNGFSRFFLPCFAGFLCSFLFPLQGQAQNRPVMDEGQPAVCEIKLKGDIAVAGKQVKLNALRKKEIRKIVPKNFKLESNEAGYFNRISGIQPNERVPIIISYPEGNAGEKVAILVQDGGTLDNGAKAKVAVLNRFRQLIFTFRVTDNPGLYRLMLRKGDDTKIIQLWVGAEQATVKF